GWRLWDTAQTAITLLQGDTPTDITVQFEDEANSYTLTWDGTALPLTIKSVSGDSIRATARGRTFTARTARHGDAITLFQDGEQHAFTVPDPLAGGSDEAADSDRVAAPMPGLVKVVSVTAGDTVSKGDAVIVMEAMKMEHTLTAPRDGTIGELLASPGDQVEEGTVLLAMAEG
ncbi:MAG: acetyl-CoA carboxylase biotin carboxyl carrier protein subunit, partial [Hyphomicrobiaceae bacterium]